MQCPQNIVLFAFILILTVLYWLECFLRDILESFRATNIAGVSIYLEEGLDLGNSRDDASNSDEMTEMCTFDLSNSKWHVGGERFEI